MTNIRSILYLDSYFLSYWPQHQKDSNQAPHSVESKSTNIIQPPTKTQNRKNWGKKFTNIVEHKIESFSSLFVTLYPFLIIDLSNETNVTPPTKPWEEARWKNNIATKERAHKHVIHSLLQGRQSKWTLAVNLIIITKTRSANT